MKEIIAKLLEYRKRTTSILIILLAIVLIALLFINGTIKNPFVGEKKNDKSDDYAKGLIDQADNALKNSKLEVTKIAPSNKISVKIATLADGDGDGIITGSKKGCDIVRFVYREIEPTPAILNATLKELFAYNQEFDYAPGNFVAKQAKLKFEKATLEEGTAKVYLTGQVEYAGACDNPRLETQIIETAKQFSTVYDVKIYLNDKEYKVPTGK